ncbi:MFS transporter [Camelimonas fluminis]|uniref:MFS transporter n=1 Tax=Camelimonas fluminis TaxID=1576911 RepID=A0ABV7UDX5_9HYPH|nr:MFS transporter [Camelimonas fluminis]GHE52202.1 MFS transporter [Camelimonas fluminis]
MRQPVAEPSLARLQVWLAVSCFTASLFVRAVDPLVPVIARDLNVPAGQVALLGSAFAFPFGLMQLVWGPVGDRFGRSGVIRICMVIISLGGVASALWPAWDWQFAMRVVCGVASAGIFPATIALIGDRVALEQRQAVLARMLGATISGGLAGAIGAGFLVEWLSWRGVFLLYGVVCAITTVAVMRVLPRGARSATAPAHGVLHGFREVLRNRRAWVCFSAVFCEGVFIFGLMPFVAVLLAARGENSPAIAGLVIAAFPLGGIIYSASAGRLMDLLGSQGLMGMGGVAAAAALLATAAGLPWQGDFAAFMVLGFGFYSLHNSLQVQATELAPAFRGSAVALHGSSFMTGQAVGPIWWGAALHLAGPALALGFGAGVIAIVGLLCGYLLKITDK